MPVYWQENQRKRRSNTEVNCQLHDNRTIQQKCHIIAPTSWGWPEGKIHLNVWKKRYPLLWSLLPIHHHHSNTANPGSHWTNSFNSPYSNMTKRGDSRRPMWVKWGTIVFAQATSTTICSSCTVEMPAGDGVEEDGSQYRSLQVRKTGHRDSAWSTKRDCWGHWEQQNDKALPPPTINNHLLSWGNVMVEKNWKKHNFIWMIGVDFPQSHVDLTYFRTKL